MFEAGKRLSQESAIIVSGVVKENPRAPGVPGGYEIDTADIDRHPELPRSTPSPQGTRGGISVENRTCGFAAANSGRCCDSGTVMQGCREWLDQHGYIEMSTTILHPRRRGGHQHLFEVDYFGEQVYLAQTGQLYNEANIYSFGKVYCFGPTFRAEKSKTRRHMTEFWMLEPEMAFFDLDDLMAMEEEFMSFLVQKVVKERRPELEVLERDISVLEKAVPPFPRISYDEAAAKIAAIREASTDPELKQLLAHEWGQDFGSPHETELTKLYDQPLFIYGFPSICKAFYMEPWPGRPEVCKSVDMLAPEGYGEITGGSERISDPDLLLRRIHEQGLPEEAFKWYLDLRKYGSVPHSGFGMGVERTVAWIAGIHHVRETNPFPRTLGRVYP